MVGTRARMGLVVATAMVAVAVPASAPGATTIGETSSAAVVTCVADFNWVQDSTAPASPSYTVPAGGGVITSWQHHAANMPASTMRLKIFRKTGANAYLTIGHSVVEPLTSGGLKTFATRVSVQAGDLLGLRTGGDTTACIQNGVAGDLARNGNIGEPDPAIGDPVSFAFDDAEDRLNVAASVEPDCDSDGFGDETQDTDILSCDTDPPETEITKGAPNKTDKSKIKFKFTSDEPGSTFECKTDKKPFKACTSPKKVKRLDEGKHKFKVRAIDAAGNVDPSAAKDKFKVVD